MGNFISNKLVYQQLNNQPDTKVPPRPPPPHMYDRRTFLKKLNIHSRDYRGFYIPEDCLYYLHLYRDDMFCFGTFDGIKHGYVNQKTDMAVIFQYPKMAVVRVLNYDWFHYFLQYGDISQIQICYRTDAEKKTIETPPDDNDTHDRMMFYKIGNESFYVPEELKRELFRYTTARSHDQSLKDTFSNISPRIDSKAQHLQCVICNDRMRQVLFLCGHFCCCKQCYLKIKPSQKCPVCNQTAVAISAFIS